MIMPTVYLPLNRENYLLLQKVGFTKAQAFALLKMFSDNNPYSKKIDDDDFKKKIDELLGEENNDRQ